MALHRPITQSITVSSLVLMNSQFNFMMYCLRTLSERLESCIYARGRYQHPTRPSQETEAFNQMCKYDFNLCYLPFLRSYVFFMLFYIFIFLWSIRVFPFALTYSSIVIRKSDLRSSFVNKAFWLFFILFCKICFY